MFPGHSLNEGPSHKTHNDTKLHYLENALIQHDKKLLNDSEPGTDTQSRRRVQNQETSEFWTGFPVLWTQQLSAHLKSVIFKMLIFPKPQIGRTQYYLIK